MSSSLMPANPLRMNLSMKWCMESRGTKLPQREKYQLEANSSISIPCYI